MGVSRSGSGTSFPSGLPAAPVTGEALRAAAGHGPRAVGRASARRPAAPWTFGVKF
ncbi:hypothetical protein GCM10022416_39150 [Actinomadura keratinilytica]|uniref:Uncharacterized protein n=1 Tax=Actinomadura keratinilytica TaxID=547461 RepID=A0ABP7Z3F7_9ACTN